MAEKKLIIGANEITEVIYIGSNLNAKGGRKKRQKRLLGDKRSDFNYDVLGRQMHEEQVVVGKYHVKNYKQRNKNRLNTVKELIENNFQPGKCMMITLHFGSQQNNEGTAPGNEINETTPEIDSTGECNSSPYVDFDKLDLFTYTEPFELDLVKLSNDFFSPKDNKEKNDSGYETDNVDRGYTDLTFCNGVFKKFIQKLNYRYDNFKYVAVMSRQENGNWHYHMVCNLDYIDFNELKQLWGQGGVYIGKIMNNTQLEKVRKYAIKNTKNAGLDLKGYRGYLSSKKGLNRNIVLRSWVNDEQMEFSKQEQRLEQAKIQVKYTKKRIVEHEYTGWTKGDEIFSEKTTCSCTFKYYTYPIQSNQYFKFLDVAKRKQDR